MNQTVANNINDYVDMIVTSGFVCAGTYDIYFDGYRDRTEFYAENTDDLIQLWHDFCFENDIIDIDIIDEVEFVCEEDI